MKRFLYLFISCWLIFSNVLAVEEVKADETKMTLDEAIEFAVKNNPSLIDLRKSDEDQKDLYENAKKDYRKWQEKVRSGGYAFENTSEYLTCWGYNLELAKLQYDSFLSNKEGGEYKVKYSVKSLIYSISELENNIALLEKTIEKQENDLEIAKVKYNLNMITENDVDTAKNTLESTKLQLENLNKTIYSLSIALKQLMGYDINEVLDIELPMYEREEIDVGNLEDVIEESLSTNISAISSKIQYKQKENQYILATKTNFLTRDEKNDAKDNYSDAEFRLNNEVKSIKENLKLLYGKVKDKEKEVKIAEDELKIAKRQFTQAKIMYKIGLISKNTFLTYGLKFNNIENNYKTKLKEEILLKDRWNIAINVGDIVEG